MAKKIPNAVGVFCKLEPVGTVAFKVCYDPDEFLDAFDSCCDERGCQECKYFSMKNSKCCRPPLVINFKPFEK